MPRRALLLAAIACAGLAMAQPHNVMLRGVVLGSNNVPKPGVAVDILGPTRVFTETNREGSFSARVVAGRYTVRVRDGSRRMEFPVVVSTESEVRLRLSW